MQRNRLVNRAQIVESVRARRPDVEPEIDLRKRTNRDCHGRGIVSDLGGESDVLPLCCPVPPVFSVVDSLVWCPYPSSAGDLELDGAISSPA